MSELWSEQRPQPPGDGEVPDRLWQVLENRLNPAEHEQFERDRAASKAQLAKRLDKLAAMPGAARWAQAPLFTPPDPTERSQWDAWREERQRVNEWCRVQEIGHFLRWCTRVKFDHRAWQKRYAAYLRGEGVEP